MKIEDIMTSNVLVATLGMSLVEAAKILRQNRIHSLPVVDEKKRLIGIITEMDFFIKDAASLYLPKWLDLLGRIREGDAFSLDEQEKMDYIIDLRVQDIMTKEVVSVYPDAQVTELLEIFKETRFKSFPVADKNKNLVGIVSLVDVIKSIEV